jgi:hypothetical protein
VAVTNGCAIRIVLALGADDLVDLGLQQLVQHPSPTPTLMASKPSFAALASSPSASRTAGGSPSMPSLLVATDAADTVLIAVGPPVLVD